MTSTRLRLTGPGQRDYVPGQSIEIFDGDEHLGTVQTVTLGAGGDEVTLADFAAADLSGVFARCLGKLIVAEVVAFVARHHAEAHSVRIELGRDVEDLAERHGVATFRTELLQGIGAEQIQVLPRPRAAHSGHFVVTGIWRYDSASLASLEAALAREREGYRPPAVPEPPARSWLNRLLKT